MSVRIMSLVFEYNMPNLKTDSGETVPDSTAKFVLLALADHCNDDGEGAYPSISRLCNKTSLSRGTVCNAVNALRNNGYTTYEGVSNRGTSNYTVSIDKLKASSTTELVQPPNFRQSSHRTDTGVPTELKPSLTIIKPSLPEKSKSSALEEFNAMPSASNGMVSRTEISDDEKQALASPQMAKKLYVKQVGIVFADTLGHNGVSDTDRSAAGKCYESGFPKVKLIDFCNNKKEYYIQQREQGKEPNAYWIKNDFSEWQQNGYPEPKVNRVTSRGRNLGE